VIPALLVCGNKKDIALLCHQIRFCGVYRTETEIGAITDVI